MNRDDIELLIELPGVYDGVSVYQMKDGTYVNRWDAVLEQYPGDLGVERKRAMAQEWIEARIAAVEEAKRQMVARPPCACRCHVFVGISHVMACCDQPPKRREETAHGD